MKHFHTSRFLGHDTDVIKLDAVTQVNGMLSHDRFLWIKPDVPMVLSDPDLNGTHFVQCWHSHTPRGCCNARCFETKVILRWSLPGLSAASGVYMKPTFRRPSRSSCSGIWYVIKLDAVTQINGVLSHCRFLWTYQIPDNDDRDSPRNVGFIQTPDAADGQRRLHRI